MCIVGEISSGESYGMLLLENLLPCLELVKYISPNSLEVSLTSLTYSLPSPFPEYCLSKFMDYHVMFDLNLVLIHVAHLKIPKN